MIDYGEISILITDTIDDAAYVSDTETHELYYVNNAILDMLGNPTEEVWRNTKCYKLLQGLDAPCDFCTNHLLNKETFYVWEYYNALIDKHLLVKDKLITFQNKDVRFEIATDITKQKNLERKLLNRLEEQKVLTECIETLNTYTSPEESVTKLLEIIATYHDAERGYIFDISKDGLLVSNTYEWCVEGVTPQIDFLQNLEASIVARWFARYEEVGEFYIDSINEEVDNESEEYRILAEQEIESLVTAPLYNKDMKLIGFIGVDNPKVHIKNTKVIKAVTKFISDFFDKNELLLKLSDLSYVDNLTKFKNRHSYNATMSRFESKPPKTLGIAYIDINGLKAINDMHGHKAGDKYIKSVADIIKPIFKGFIYRIGGDEFVILAENFTEKAFEEKINLLKENVVIDGKSRASIGFTWNKNGRNIEQQIEEADNLMYSAKQTLYAKENKNKKYTMILSQNLDYEIRDGRYLVYLQPQIDLHTKKIASAEALVRKLDTNGNIQPPINFIPFYEQEGLISKIDFFVFEEVCKFYNSWTKDGFDFNIQIVVNFSRLTFFEKGIAPKMEDICKKYGVPTTKLVIEVTEAVNNVDPEILKSVTEKFVEAGFLVSFDEFESEDNSLSIINTSTFDEIKLDKRLVDDLPNNTKSKIVTELAVKMCNKLSNITSLAEGIETIEQYNVLKEMKCSKGQGFYFDKPLPFDDFTEKYIANDFTFKKK